MPTPNALECSDPRFVKAVRQMKSAEALPDAVAAFSEIIEEGDSDFDEGDLAKRGECKSLSLWLRGVCQQRLGLYAEDLRETMAYFRSAQVDYRAAVELRPTEFARQMASDRWFPENDFAIPAYIEFLQRLPTSNELFLSYVVAAIGNMGAEATEALPALRGYSRPTIFKHQFAQAANRIAEPSRRKLDGIEGLFAAISTELQDHWMGRDSIDEAHWLTHEEIGLSQDELVQRVTDRDWRVRIKAVCILGFTKKPKPNSIRALLGSLANDKRASVRCMAATSLCRLVNSESDLLSEVTACLSSALSKGNDENLNVQQALVRAIGQCGPSAKAALPHVLRFKPHPKDLTGDVIKAAAIMRIAPSDHPLVAKCTKKLLDELRQGPRATRAAAIEAVQVVPLDHIPRKKVLLDRMFFDDSARLRCQAARALIRLDIDLANKAGAFLALERIGQ